MVSKINHDIRKKMEIGIEDFVVADILNQLRKPTSLSELSTETMIRTSSLQSCLNELISREYVEVGKKSGKFSTTSLWKNSVKEVKEKKEANPIIHLMQLAILEDEELSDYQWSAREATLAGELSDKLKYSYKVRFNEEPKTEDILNSFKMLLDNLPKWHVDNFSLSRIVSDYNGIISTIKSKYRKPPGASPSSLNSALDLL